MATKWNGRGDMFSAGFATWLDRELTRVCEGIQASGGDGRKLAGVQRKSLELLDDVTHSPCEGRAIPFERDRLFSDSWKVLLNHGEKIAYSPTRFSCFHVAFCREQLPANESLHRKFRDAVYKLVEFVVDGDDIHLRRGLADELELMLRDYLALRPPVKAERGRPRKFDSNGQRILDAWKSGEYHTYLECARALGIMKKVPGKGEPIPDDSLVRRVVRNASAQKRRPRKKKAG